MALRSATGLTIRPGGLSVLETALERYPFPPGARVLDVGCGLGASVAYLRRHNAVRAVGVDLSRTLLREGGRSFPSLPLAQARAEFLPVAENSCDGLVCECVLSLASGPANALSEFHRVLVSGGRLILSDIYRRNPSSDGSQLPCRSCLSGAAERTRILGWLADAGFSVLLWEDHSRLLAELAAELVFMHGSMSAFWQQFSRADDGARMAQVVRAMRPGYYLAVAERT